MLLKHVSGVYLKAKGTLCRKSYCLVNNISRDQ